MQHTACLMATLLDRIWEQHIAWEDSGQTVLYADLHFVHEVSSPQAFEGLRLAGRRVRRRDLTIATMDHNVPTDGGPVTDPLAKAQLDALARNCAEFEIPLYATGSGREGIVHVIGPELGLTQPGMTIVCGDSHTSTHGAFGALAFGIGTSEVEHVLATQTLQQRKPKAMRVTFEGTRASGVSAKDMILGAIRQIGVAGGRGHVIEYAGEAIRRSPWRSDDRLQHVDRSWCARGNDCARRYDVPVSGGPAGGAHGAAWEPALDFWRGLRSDDDAVFDREIG